MKYQLRGYDQNLGIDTGELAFTDSLTDGLVKLKTGNYWKLTWTDDEGHLVGFYRESDGSLFWSNKSSEYDRIKKPSETRSEMGLLSELRSEIFGNPAVVPDVLRAAVDGFDSFLKIEYSRRDRSALLGLLDFKKVGYGPGTHRRRVLRLPERTKRMLASRKGFLGQIHRNSRCQARKPQVARIQGILLRQVVE
jgi:hypothetical protein